MNNRDDKGCLLGFGVYIEIECAAFACFELSLYADKNYVSNAAIKLNNRKKIMLNQIYVYVINSFRI